MGIDDIVDKARKDAQQDHEAQIEAVAAAVKDNSSAQIDEILNQAAERAKERG